MVIGVFFVGGCRGLVSWFLVLILVGFFLFGFLVGFVLLCFVFLNLNTTFIIIHF